MAKIGIVTLEDRKHQTSVSGELAQTIAIALRGTGYSTYLKTEMQSDLGFD